MGQLALTNPHEMRCHMVNIGNTLESLIPPTPNGIDLLEKKAKTRTLLMRRMKLEPEIKLVS